VDKNFFKKLILCYTNNNMYKNILLKILFVLLIANILIISGINFNSKNFKLENTQASSFDAGYIIDDSKFIAKDDMSVNDIQRFLEEKGSELRHFSENGRSAAQIIYDAAHGHGEASGPPPNGCFNGICINRNTGTVSPKVLLVTMQKEQSLITNHYAYGDKQRAYDCAMGYEAGRGCRWMFENRPQWRGFTNQVEWAAWQLRYNYERAAGYGFSDWQVGQSFCWDNICSTYKNRATSALYRYTPHIQYSFSNLYRNYFGSPVGNRKNYHADLTSKSNNPTLRRNQSVEVEVKFVNTGWETWHKGGDNPVRLALDRNWASRTAWQGSDWISENRIAEMIEDSVSPGQTATFRFELKAPDSMRVGTHRFHARLVSEFKEWFDNPRENGYVYWDINVPHPQAQWISQSENQIVALPGETKDLWVKFKNTDSSNWITPVRLATDKLMNENFLKRFKHDSWVNDYRISESTSSIAPNSEHTFNFKIKIPQDLRPGRYRFDTRLVSESYSWFERPDTNGAAWWEIIVPEPKAEWIEQSSYPAMHKGDSTTLWVKFKNTSSFTWRSSGNNPVRLGLDRYWNHSTVMQGMGWINENRLNTAQEGDINPGQTGTYRFNIYIPPDKPSGKYRFHVRLVSEFFSWFEPDINGAAWWEVTVL